MPPLTDDDLLHAIALSRPLIDVRAPVEFAHGSVPNAVNLPLLNDEERAQIGTVYKQRGSDAAITLGHELIAGDVRDFRLSAWETFARRYPDAMIYCFRGGLRSQSVQKALKDRGYDLPLIPGGYKRVRQLLMTVTERLTHSQTFEVVSGFTGTRKTDLLNSLRGAKPVCDLEGLAHHKGSAFGPHLNCPQPAQADFENRLAVELYCESGRGSRSGPIAIEDESRMIGYNVLPPSLHAKIQTSAVYLVEGPRPERAAYLTASYLAENVAGAAHTDPEALRQPILERFKLIQRRLGGLEYSKLVRSFEDALTEQRRSGRIESHYKWVERLLEVYYDPLYQFHLAKIQGRVVARGSYAEIRERLLTASLA